MEKGFCGEGRQRQFHFLQKVGGFAKVGVKNLMQDAVTVARGLVAIASRQTQKPPSSQNFNRTPNNILKIWGKP